MRHRMKTGGHVLVWRGKALRLVNHCYRKTISIFLCWFLSCVGVIAGSCRESSVGVTGFYFTMWQNVKGKWNFVSGKIIMNQGQLLKKGLLGKTDNNDLRDFFFTYLTQLEWCKRLLDIFFCPLRPTLVFLVFITCYGIFIWWRTHIKKIKFKNIPPPLMFDFHHPPEHHSRNQTNKLRRKQQRADPQNHRLQDWQFQKRRTRRTESRK